MIKKFKSFIQEEWKFLVFLFILYLGMTFELPYVIYTPGGHIDMGERVSGKNTYEANGSLNMTYVSMVKGTAPFLLLSAVLPNWDVVSKDKVTYNDADLKETVEIDKIYMREAISNATYVAFKKANIDFEVESTKNIVTFVDKNANTELHYGDMILSVDGESYSTLSEFQNYVSAKAVGDEISIEYERDGKRKVDVVTLIDLDGKPKVGISIASVSEYESDFDIEVGTKPSESGPSGGLITALEIYNKITSNDLTKGKTIMGTGTIDKDGTVGEIGGVKYKLLGAYKDKAQIFICPLENYEEALKVKEEEEMDIILIGVSTIDEALEKLNNI